MESFINCPACLNPMTGMTLDAHLGSQVTIDLCAKCQAFWFDKYESLKLTPGSILRLMKIIGENAAGKVPSVPERLQCPRCAVCLRLTNDMQRNTRFTYWRCTNEHGRWIRFVEFLREKDFIRPLSREQLAELRQNIQSVNCSGCGAPVDLNRGSICEHCGSPLSMLDMTQSEAMLSQLARASEPHAADSELPLKLAMARRDVERSLGPEALGPEWWQDASGSGLVQAGLSAFARFLNRVGF